MFHNKWAKLQDMVVNIQINSFHPIMRGWNQNAKVVEGSESDVVLRGKNTQTMIK